MLPQGEHQFLFVVRVGCVVVWPIFSTSKMKAFCIYFYQGNITFKNIINLVSFIINLVEYLVINSYSVTVLNNVRKETSDRAKSIFFGGIQQPHFHSGNPTGPPPWSAILDEGLMKVSLWQFELPHLIFYIFYHISTGKRALQLLYSCMALSITWIKSADWIPCSSHPWIETVKVVLFTFMNESEISCWAWHHCAHFRKKQHRHIQAANSLLQPNKLIKFINLLWPTYASVQIKLNTHVTRDLGGCGSVAGVL